MGRSNNEVVNLILKKLNKKCILNYIRVNSVWYRFSCSKMEICEVLTDGCRVSEGKTQLP